MALAAATAPSLGTMLEMDACPDEITTMCLPLAAGRDVGLTGRLVPCSDLAVAATAACKAEDDPPAVVAVLDELPPVAVDFLLLELHAAASIVSTASATNPLRATVTIAFPPGWTVLRRGIVGGIVAEHTADRLLAALRDLSHDDEERRWAASGAM